MKSKRGITLIVLVITIIVILILAGAVILSLLNSNIINQANEATFKANITSYNSELVMDTSNQYLQNGSFNPNSFNASVWDGTEENKEGTIKEYITNIEEKDALKFEIQKGKLIYVGTDQKEKDWITDMGIPTGNITLPYTTIKPQLLNVEKYKLPYVPTGFTYKEGTWRSGLVIEDSAHNEFVWVPVDNTSVKYLKLDAAKTSASSINTTDGILPLGINNEIDQVTNYGGFYVARYEAGKESDTTLVSKKNAIVWNDINWADAKTKAESMFNTVEVKSGLITGTQWDTLMKWLQVSGKDTSLDSSSWGNYGDSVSPANASGYGNMQNTGYSEYWKAKNIYDIAGNAWEWTNETYGSDSSINRSGVCFASGAGYPAGYRGFNYSTNSSYYLTFRLVLYIL